MAKSDLISKKALLKELRAELRECRADADECGGENILWAEGIEFAIDTVKQAKVVDVVEVGFARWHKPTPCSQEFCTNCGRTPRTNFGWLPPYCPRCGSRMMDGDGNV